MMNFEEYKIEHLSDFEELTNFYTGKDKMDDFLHNHLKQKIGRKLPKSRISLGIFKFFAKGCCNVG